MYEDDYRSNIRRSQVLQRENLTLRAQVDRQAGRIRELEKKVDEQLYQMLVQEHRDLKANIKEQLEQLYMLEDQLKRLKNIDRPAERPELLFSSQDDDIDTILNEFSASGHKGEYAAGSIAKAPPSAAGNEVTKTSAEQPEPAQDDGKSKALDDPAVPPAETKSMRRRILGMAGSAVFYAALALILVGAFFIRSAQDGAPLNIAGYSGMLVLSGSMQDVIPKDSFLLTKSVDADTLAVGDDITFMTNSTTSVTHRIIEILPQPDGTLAFRTQGVNNSAPDNNPVNEANIVGKVIYHNYRIGLAAKWISTNWPILAFLMAVWIGLGFVLRMLNSDKGEEAGKEDKPSRQERRTHFKKAANRPLAGARH